MQYLSIKKVYCQLRSLKVGLDVQVTETSTHLSPFPNPFPPPPTPPLALPPHTLRLLLPSSPGGCTICTSHFSRNFSAVKFTQLEEFQEKSSSYIDISPLFYLKLFHCCQKLFRFVS